MFRHISPFSLFCIFLLMVLVALGGCQKSPAASTNELTSEGAVVEPTDSPPADVPIPTPTTAPLLELNFTLQTTAPIPATGETVTTEAGASVQIAPDVLGDGVEAELSQWEIDPSWRQALEQAYTIDTPFVSLAAAGVNDSQGRAVLRLPAPGPDSRLVIFVDNTYLAVLDALPQDGFLETAVRLGPANSDTMEQVGSLTPGGSLQYTVLTPRSTAAAKSHLGKPAVQNGRSCGLTELSPDDADHNYSLISHCRKSADGTVQVNFLSASQFSDAEGDQLADAVAAAMTRYGPELGFTAAKLAPGSPMQVVVEMGSGDPRYRSMNGVIYLPLDAARGMIGSAGHDVLHEMAHWIQDEEYNMAWAYWSGGKTWWLETAAENMVMLHDPAYISQNLVTYGAITTSDNRLALQQSPYQWPGDFYAQAQLVKLNMCDDTAVCPLSEKSFVAAINAGTYPFDSADAQGKLSANLDAYAQYLLGTTPGGGNTAMPIGEPVTNGDSYGEYIQIAQTTKSDYDLSFTGLAPQMQPGTDDLGDTVVVSAALQKDGVYPLSINSGFNGRTPGLPVKLTIQPGAPFWYRIGSDAPQFNDGSEELVLQPIHLTLGLPGVRLVALGQAGGETFQATVSQIDLQGAWLVIPGEPINDNITCVNNTESDSINISLNSQSLLMLPTYFDMLGDYRPDVAGNGLTWEENTSRTPAEFASYVGSDLHFEGAVLSGVDKIQMQNSLEWVRATSQAPARPQWPPLLFGLAMVVPGVWGLHRGRKRPYASLVSFVLVIFLLAGCAGFNMWGTVTSDTQFTEVEYLGGEAVPVIGAGSLPDAPPLWKLRGTADYTVDFYVEASTDTEDGSTTAVSHCTGTATYNVEAQVFKDIIVNLD